MTMGSKTGNYGRQTDQTAVLDICIIRHPGNWLPLLRGQKRRKATKNDVKLQKPAQNQRKNSPKRQV